MMIERSHIKQSYPIKQPQLLSKYRDMNQFAPILSEDPAQAGQPTPFRRGEMLDNAFTFFIIRSASIAA
jgi:hypothetical protein